MNDETTQDTPVTPDATPLEVSADAETPGFVMDLSTEFKKVGEQAPANTGCPNGEPGEPGPAGEVPQPEIPDPRVQPVMVKPGTKAQIQVTWPGEAGAEPRIEKLESSRNTVQLFKTLQGVVAPDHPDVGAIKVTITLAGKVADTAVPPDANGVPALKDVTVTLYGGTAAEVYAQLEGRTVSPQEAIVALQRFVTELTEISDLRGIIITCVYGGVGLGGFSMLNDLVPQEDSDVILLGMGSGGQSMQFMDAMRATRKIEFPGDSKIVTPGQIGMPPSALRNFGHRR